MKRIYAIKVINGEVTTIHEFKNKEALISYASSKIYEDATHSKTINELLEAIGLDRIYSYELEKFYKPNQIRKISWLIHY